MINDWQRRERAVRREYDTAEFWPNNGRAFCKKFAATHPDVWTVMLQLKKGDKPAAIAEIDRLLQGKFRDRDASDLARAFVKNVPLMRQDLEQRATVEEYWRQRLAEEEGPEPARMRAVQEWMADESARAAHLKFWRAAEIAEENLPSELRSHLPTSLSGAAELPPLTASTQSPPPQSP